LFTYIP